MKKIVSLFLALCMCMCLAPCTFVSAAAGDVLASYTFDDLGGVDQKHALTDGGKDGFRSIDGKLVYDSTSTGAAETESAAREVYISKTITGQKMTIEMELCFEGNFTSNTTNLQGRFCGANAAGGAQLKNLIWLNNEGKLWVNTDSRAQLTLGKTHKISLVLVPNETSTDYTSYLYVDGVSYGQASVGLSNATNLDFYMFIISFNNSGKKETKFSFDNLYFIEDESRMAITSSDTIYKAPADVSVVYPFEAEYVHGDAKGSDGITWEITKNADKVKVDANGNVSILDNSVTSFEIKASKTISGRTLSAVKTINLLAAEVHDFESATVGGTATGWTSCTVQEEVGGNNYLQAPASGNGDFYTTFDMSEGNNFSIFECRVRIPEIPTSTVNFITTVGTKAANSTSNEWRYFKCNTSGEIYDADAGTSAGTRKIQSNKWFNFKIENDLKNKIFNIYVDGIKVNENPISTEAIDRTRIRVNNAFHYDDIKFYNGKLDQKITGISAEEEVLYVPVDSGKNASTSFTATLKDNTFTPEWSLYGTYTGIEIDKNTGKLIINKDAQAGDLAADKLTVTVMATAGGVSFEKKESVTLYKYDSDDFNTQTVGQKPSGNWLSNYGLVAQEGNGNYYVAPQLQTNSNYEARYKVNKAIGNFVIEAKVKINSNVASGRMFAYNQDGGNGSSSLFDITTNSVYNANDNYHYPTMSVDAANWVNIKAVMNVAANTTTVFVNDKLLGASNIPMTAATKTASVDQIIFRGLDVDDLKVYNINDTTPGAYNAYLENIAVGKASAPVYNYFDEGGQAEECTSYLWYIGDTADGSFSEISGATEKTYTPTAADLGKYIYVKITPASDESHTGVAVKTAPEKVGDIAIGDITYKVNGTAKKINEIAIAMDGTEQTISLTMPARYTGSEPKDVFIIIGKYVDGQFSIVGYEKATLTSTDTDITVEGNVAIPVEDAGKTALKAFIWDGTLSPLFEVKNLK